mgnify:CR=1 FL=1
MEKECCFSCCCICCDDFCVGGGGNAQPIDLDINSFTNPTVSDPGPHRHEGTGENAGIFFDNISRTASTIYIGKTVTASDTLNLNSDLMYKAIQENWGRVGETAAKNNTGSSGSILDIFKDVSKPTISAGSISLNDGKDNVDLNKGLQTITFQKRDLKKEWLHMME